ncbi:beta-ketoacyl-[acyl-carrier-protein] synthase family protein [Caldimonas brevitalea]|uniref:3-oxoacyl-ACP synthase n=1 Tax=Caldimonas brevitalea TaxID=413882 RepID=A0A0G3BU76_9BURK|nr:beta-ketoacyl-[acyl-carrier-protein] synthase family protein [Caldimonas brevitalea]AKJ30085.1 3-oxoacyl-ACP synthase [Caldimonas brevitalea]
MQRASAGVRRRVVVTGIGAVTSIGIGVSNFLTGLREGRSGASQITAFDVKGFDHSLGCEVKNFDAAQLIRDLPLEEFGRASQFTAAAARMAVEDAALPLDRLREMRSMVVVGTTDGESRDIDHLTQLEVTHGWRGLDPVLAGRVSAGRLSVAAARELGLQDVEAVTLPTACAAGNYAIGYGCDAVRSGEVDIALCGGADAVCLKTFAGFYRLGTIAPVHCQPFDIDRKGILTGEGAGMLVLESLESAQARGARIYAEVLGYGLNCDADHPVAPNEDSFARCMRLAHADAGVSADDVDLISAHGTGTKANDVSEARAVRQVFGGEPPKMISIKSMIGHTMGAASALAAIACILGIREGFIPPTINHVQTDPECDIDCVPNVAIAAELDIVQNNALAFGGNNAVLILGRYAADGIHNSATRGLS